MPKIKKQWEVRYFVTAVASVPLYKCHSKTETYKQAAKPGWGTVEWYSAADDYKNPVARDRSDKTQQLCCDEDCSASLYTKNGGYFGIFPYITYDTAAETPAGSATAPAGRPTTSGGPPIPPPLLRTAWATWCGLRGRNTLQARTRPPARPASPERQK